MAINLTPEILDGGKNLRIIAGNGPIVTVQDQAGNTFSAFRSMLQNAIQDQQSTGLPDAGYIITNNPNSSPLGDPSFGPSMQQNGIDNSNVFTQPESSSYSGIAVEAPTTRTANISGWSRDQLIQEYKKTDKEAKEASNFGLTDQYKTSKAYLDSLVAAAGGNNIAATTRVRDTSVFQGGGYAYMDKYGFTHVVNEFETALEYAKDPGELTTDNKGNQVYSSPGAIYAYKGTYGGGYALTDTVTNTRINLPLTGAKNFGNLQELDEAQNAYEQTMLTREEYDKTYPGTLGQVIYSQA